MEKRVIGFVGAHMDDIELACSGTVQRVIKNGYEAVVLVISVDPKRIEANKRSAELLGYNLILGDISQDEIEITKVQQIVYEKLLRPFGPRMDAVFLHLPEDYNHHHRFVSAGSISACRGAKNVFYFAGPGGIPHLRPQVFIPFAEEEMKKKMEAVKILRQAYGPARYFTPEHNEGLASFWGQWTHEFIERPKESKVTLFGKEQLPYAEVFQVERLRMGFEEGKTIIF